VTRIVGGVPVPEAALNKNVIIAILNVGIAEQKRINIPPGSVSKHKPSLAMCMNARIRWQAKRGANAIGSGRKEKRSCIAIQCTLNRLGIVC
jgi:hypothetical protein